MVCQGWSISEFQLRAPSGKPYYLVDVVMNMLACDDRSHRVTLLCAALDALILELGALLLETSFDGLRITVMMLTSLDGEDVVFVTLRENFAILYWLNRSVEMILVNFPIDGCLSFFMAMLHHSLLCNSGSNSLVDSGVMVPSLRPVHKDSQRGYQRRHFTGCAVRGELQLQVSNKIIQRSRRSRSIRLHGRKPGEKNKAYIKSLTAAFALSILIYVL